MRITANFACILVLLGFFCPAAFAQNSAYSDIVLSAQGRPIAGAAVSVCSTPGLATTAASVTSNIAVLTFGSSPVTAGFVAGMTLQVSGFTGGDTYLNGGTLSGGVITGGFTILSVTSTTVSYALVHANASATSNGNAFQQGNTVNSCAPLASISSDVAGLNAIAQPGLTTDGLGNYAFFAGANSYLIQLSGTGITLKLKPVNLPCSGSANCTYSGTATFTGALNANGVTTLADCKTIGSVFCIDATNSQGWSGSDFGAQVNTILASAGFPAGGSDIWVFPGSYTQSTAIVLNKASTTIHCLNWGAVITQSVANGIQVTASDTRVTGCNLVASGVANSIDAPNTVSRLEIDHNKFSGYANLNGVLRIGDRTNTTLGAAVTDISVHDNLFSNNSSGDVNVQDYALRVSIKNNISISTNSSATFPLINAQTSDSNTTIQTLTITGNQMLNGISNDCVQVQQLVSTGTVISDVVVSDNICLLSTGASHGNGTGYSLAGVTGFTRKGNIFDANGQTFLGTNPPFELVSSSIGSSSGNTAVMGTQSGSSGTGPIFDFNGGVSNNMIDETASMSYTGTGGSIASGCFYIGTSLAASTIKNSLKSSTCDLTGSSGKAYALFMQSNNAGATVSKNEASLNTFIGANVTGDGGITVENDAGTMANNIIGPNQVSNFHLPYSQNLGAQTAGLNTSALSTYTSPDSLGNATPTSPATLTLKKGSGAGNYTGTNTSYANVDTTNLCFAVTVPTGWKLAISSSGDFQVATASAGIDVALFDIGTTCGGAGTTTLIESRAIPANVTQPQAFALNWVLTGDGAAHAISLQAHTENAADAWAILNSTATITPTMVFTLMPSN